MPIFKGSLFDHATPAVIVKGNSWKPIHGISWDIGWTFKMDSTGWTIQKHNLFTIWIGRVTNFLHASHQLPETCRRIFSNARLSTVEPNVVAFTSLIGGECDSSLLEGFQLLGEKGSASLFRRDYTPEVDWVVVLNFKYVLFSPRKLEKWSNFNNIFQMGWNHQLVEHCPWKMMVGRLLFFSMLNFQGVST